MTDQFSSRKGYIFISSSDDTVYPVQLIPNMSSENNTSDSLSSTDNVFGKVPKLEWTNPSSEISDNNKDPYQSNSSQTSFQNNSEEQYYNFQTPKEELFNVQEMDCSIVLDEQHTDNVLKNSETSVSKTKVLNCSRCMYQTSDKNNLTNHMRKHNSTFVCKICKTSFSVITSLIDHFNKQHPQDADDPSDLQHYCPMCPFQSIEKLEYDKHITRHETAAHTCSICGQPFAKQVSMKWHIKYKHGIEDSEDQQHSNISETSTTTTTISYHNNAISANTEKESKDLDFQNQSADMETDTKPFCKRFFCLYCPKNFSNKLYLKYHCWRNHKDRLYKSQWKEVQDLFQQNWNETDPTLITKSLNAKNSHFQCPMCSFSSSYKSTVDRHIKKHNEAKYSCNICDMPFTVIGNLHHHKKVNHPEILIMNSLPNKRHKCALCIYSTGYKSTLERHLRTHGIAKYHCELCTMPFVFSGSFLTHRMLKHKLSSKDFEETIFTDKITDASSLTASSGKFIKRRKCPYCNALMPSASKLNRHLRTHRNAGYYCVCCSIFYTLRSEFENHMKVHLVAKGFNEVQCIGVTKGIKELSNDTAGDKVDSSAKNHILVNSEQSNVRESSLSNEISNMNNITELGNVDKNCDMYSNSSNINDNRSHLATIAKVVVKIDLTEPVPTTNILLEQPQVLQNDSQSYPPESYQNSLSINSAKKLMLSSPSQEITPSFDKPTTEENFHLTPSSRNSLMSTQDSFTIDRSTYMSQMPHEQYFETEKQDFRLNSDEVLFNNQKMYLTPQQQNPMNNSNTTEIQTQNPFSENNNDDMCACKLTPPIHGDVLINPPFKGRFAKLVSDFDDFASRPFACSLCFYRCSILKDLFDHVQNHLTGCTPIPVPNTAKFDTQNYTQGMSINQNNQMQNNSLSISYI